MASAVFESNCTRLSIGIQGSATVPRGIRKGAMPALPWCMFTGSGQVFSWLSICHLEKLFSVGSRTEVSCRWAILKLVWNVHFCFLVQPWLWGVDTSIYTSHLVHTSHSSHITSLTHHNPHISHPHTSHPSHITPLHITFLTHHTTPFIPEIRKLSHWKQHVEWLHSIGEL